jgi:hypothetical protein
MSGSQIFIIFAKIQGIFLIFAKFIYKETYHESFHFSLSGRHTPCRIPPPCPSIRRLGCRFEINHLTLSSKSIKLSFRFPRMTKC